MEKKQHQDRLRSAGWFMIVLSLGSFTFMGALAGAGPIGLVLFAAMLSVMVVGIVMVVIARTRRRVAVESAGAGSDGFESAPSD